MHFGRGAETGWPDDFFGIEGTGMWIEFKAEGKKPTKKQLRCIERMREKGFNAMWTDNAQAATTFMEQLRTAWYGRRG